MLPTAAEARDAKLATAQAAPAWRNRRRSRAGIDLNGIGVLPVAPGPAAPMVGCKPPDTSPALGRGLHGSSKPRAARPPRFRRGRWVWAETGRERPALRSSGPARRMDRPSSEGRARAGGAVQPGSRPRRHARTWQAGIWSRFVPLRRSCGQSGQCRWIVIPAMSADIGMARTPTDIVAAMATMSASSRCVSRLSMGRRLLRRSRPLKQDIAGIGLKRKVSRAAERFREPPKPRRGPAASGEAEFCHPSCGGVLYGADGACCMLAIIRLHLSIIRFI